MDQRKKRQKYILIGVSVLVILAAAGSMIYMKYLGRSTHIAENFGFLNTMWYTDKGAFAYEDIYLKYYSPANRKKVLVCNRKGCDHQDDCPAVFDGFVTGITYDSTGLLFLSDEDTKRLGEITLFHSNTDGTNRRKIHTFSSVQTVTNVHYYGERMVICYLNQLDQEGNTLEKEEAGMIVYDIRSGTETNVFRDSKINAYIGTCSLYDETLYFAYSYSDMEKEEALQHAQDTQYADGHFHSEVCSVSVSGGDTARIIDDINWSGYLPVADGKIVYSSRKAVYFYDIDSGRREKIYDGSSEVIPILPQKEKSVIIRPYKEISNGTSVYYRLDIRTGEMTKIGNGDIILQVVAGDTAYYVNLEGSPGCCSREQFFAGKATGEELFEGN